MMAWIAWALGGVLLGGVVHLATILVLPMTASRDSFSRLEPARNSN